MKSYDYTCMRPVVVKFFFLMKTASFSSKQKARQNCFRLITFLAGGWIWIWCQRPSVKIIQMLTVGYQVKVFLSFCTLVETKNNFDFLTWRYSAHWRPWNSMQKNHEYKRQLKKNLSKRSFLISRWNSINSRLFWSFFQNILLSIYKHKTNYLQNVQ